MRDLRLLRWTLAATSVLGCGQGSSPDGTDHEPSDRLDAGAEAAVARDSGTGPFNSSMSSLDASAPTLRTVTPECTPGHYRGDFSCLIVGLLPWSGDMDFSLVAMSDNADEFSTLVVVPGTRITGHDTSFDGTFDAELKGTFDCKTGQLSGSMSGSYFTPNLGFPLAMSGELKGLYGRDAGANAFQGEMGPLKSPDLDLLGPLAPDATCTWKAMRVSDVLRDAGMR